MDTTTAASDALPSKVEQRIADYRPTAISPTEWDACRPSIVPLVRACPPADPGDARDLLTTAVRFLKAMHPITDSWNLIEVLTDANLERFKQQWLRSGAPLNTLRNHLARLNRLRRTVHGGSGARRSRTGSRPASRGTRIYTDAEVAALRGAIDQAPSDVAGHLARALELGGRGLILPEAYSTDIDREGWQHARSWLATQELPVLDGRKLRRTWAHRLASSSSLVEVVQAGVTRNELDGLLPHLDDVGLGHGAWRMRAQPSSSPSGAS